MAADGNGGQQGTLADTAARYGLPFLGQIDEACFDAALVARLPLQWARTHCILPVRRDGRVFALTADPAKLAELDDLGLLLGEDVAPILADRDVILRSIERCYFAREDNADAFIGELASAAPARAAAAPVGHDLLQTAENAPVTQLVNLILIGAVKQRASDVHFEPFSGHLRVRYRIDGVLHEQTSPPRALEDALISRLKVMANLDIAERRLPQDGTANVRVGERAIDIRVSTVPVADGERVVLRLLDKDAELLTPAGLGMRPAMLSRFERVAAAANGIVVVCGPTGSGKTTTLYAALQRMDTAHRNVLTIEDPIEYRLAGVGQIQVKPKIGLTFATGLRHILRQDPDVVLVGETRDLETAAIAMRASLTGHLVLTTLHTNDAPGAVTRLLDMGVEPYVLAACLRGVLAQRLVRRVCRQCRQEVPAPSVPGAAGWRAALAGRRVFAAAGCAACLDGYHGRMGLFELMVVDEPLAAAIRGGRDAGECRQLAVLAGMASLGDDAVGKILDGETTIEEVGRVID